MRRILASLVFAAVFSNPALAAVVTRSYQVDASDFWHFSGNAAPFLTLKMQFQLTFDDTKNSDIIIPDKFFAFTDGQLNVGPFSAAPGFKYFVNQGMGEGPVIFLGGLLNGYNISMPGTDDFGVRFNANIDGERYAMLGFSTVKSGSFTAINAVVRPFNTAASAIPEPATWIMFLCAFGLVGAVFRRDSRPVFRNA